MGVAALLGGLVLIILILGFVTALQNRSVTRKGRTRKAPALKNEAGESLEERHPSHQHKKSSAQHRPKHETVQRHHRESSHSHEHQDREHQEREHLEKHNNVSGSHKHH